MSDFTIDALEGALRRHIGGTFTFRTVAEQLVAEGWTHPAIAKE